VVYSLVSLVQDMDAQGQWEHKTKGSQVRKMFYMDVESTLLAMRCAGGYGYFGWKGLRGFVSDR
jgi:hypothetical protein